jgi:hypothetical protein
MSATIDINTVITAIEGLTITGVTIAKPSDNVGVMQDHLLSLATGPTITNARFDRVELSAQNLNFRYTLTYHYYHCALGGMNATNAMYSGLITSIGNILKAFASHVTLAGAVDNMYPQLPVNGILQDAAGNSWFGAVITIDILQFLEV